MLYLVAFFILFQIANSEWDGVPYNPEEVYSQPGYGDSWMYIPDGNGDPQKAYLKGGDKPGMIKNFIANDVTYDLYTRKQKKRQMLKLDDITSLKSSSIDLSKDIKFVTHGWLSSNQSNTCQDIKDAYLKTKDFNVIIVDWAPLSKNAFYNKPVQHTRTVGAHVAKMMQFLVENGSSLDKIHCVGHSLGAQVCGFAGANLGGKLGRITGLDPAQPNFSSVGNDGKLDSSDAKFVDIIHTCGGLLGYGSDFGHVDFYPNGGTPNQPGCNALSVIMLDACSHGRSWRFFVDSIIEPKAFKSKSCESWDKFKKKSCNKTEEAFMGEYVNQQARGSYFLWTTAKRPFKTTQRL